MREDNRSDHDPSTPSPPAGREPAGYERDERGADEGVRVVGVDDDVAVAAVSPGGVVDRLDAAGEQRDEQDVELDGRQHERPEGDEPLARFHACRETEVARDHYRAAGWRGAGQGIRRSSRPITTTNRMRPTMKDMRGRTLFGDGATTRASYHRAGA